MATEETVNKAMQTAMNDNPTWLVMRAIHNEMGSDFRDRVPEPTATNVSEFGQAILQDQTTLNEFATSVVQKFAMTFFNTTFINNRLKKFKKGKVDTGFKIEEIFVQAAKGTKYDPENSPKEELKQVKPVTDTIIHVENSRLKYPASVSNAQVKSAFTSWQGVNSLFVQIIQSMYDGYELDEFTLMKMLIVEYAKKGLFKFVKVAPISGRDSVDDFVITLKTYSNLLEFPSDEYNAMDVIKQTPKDQQHVILRAKEDARISVKSLASAFNMDEMNFYGNRDMIDNFGPISNAMAVLISNNWYQVYDTDEEMTSLYVRDGRYWKYNYHRWGIFSVSRFEPAIMFVTDYSNPVTSVLVSPTIDVVKRGSTLELVASPNIVDDTTLPEGEEPTLPPLEEGGERRPLSKKVTWQLGGNDNVGTTISVDPEDGNKVILSVSEDETARELRIKATSVDNENATGTAYIQVGNFFGQ